ncbi:MAG: hypothetical protein FWF59_07100 [Turicibacter sp.]|nr:hypothetical protein [Turicibacter sp.]
MGGKNEKVKLQVNFQLYFWTLAGGCIGMFLGEMELGCLFGLALGIVVGKK